MNHLGCHLLHQLCCGSLALAVCVAAWNIPVESSDAAGNDDLAFLFYIAFLVTCVEKLKKSSLRVMHSRHVDSECLYIFFWI